MNRRFHPLLIISLILAFYSVISKSDAIVPSFPESPSTTIGTGSTFGPGSSTDEAIVRWDGAAGTLIQNSINGPFGKDNGSFGIGTNTPDYKFHAAESTDGQTTVIIIENSFANASDGNFNATADIDFAFGGQNNTARIAAGKEDTYTSAATRDSYIAFETELNDVLTERMRLKSTGTILIPNSSILDWNTRSNLSSSVNGNLILSNNAITQTTTFTTSGTGLDINDNVTVLDKLNILNTQALAVGDQGLKLDTQFYIRESNGTSNPLFQMDSNDWMEYIISTNNFSFNTSSTERMRIGTDIGINDTSPDARLDINGSTTNGSSLTLQLGDSGDVAQTTMDTDGNIATLGTLSVGSLTESTQGIDVTNATPFLTIKTATNTRGGIILGNAFHGLERGYPDTANNDIGLWTTGGNIYLSANGRTTINAAWLETAGSLHIARDLEVGDGTTTGCVVDGDGTVLAGVCISDVRLKDVIGNVESTKNKVKNIDIVEFTWKEKRTNNDKNQIGVIAQQVKEIDNSLVIDEDKYLKVDFQRLQFMFYKAIQETIKDVENLEKLREIVYNQSDEIKELRERIIKLEKKENKKE